MQSIESKDGCRLHVNDWGSGPPVVLIHGWPLSSAMWEYQAVSLVQRGFRVISYDRRGFGRSDQPAGGYDYDTFADDLAAVIAATGARGVSLVGFSMGGGEVARYLSRHGRDNVVAAVLMSAVTPFMLKTPDHDGVPGSVFEDMKLGIRADRPHFMAGFAKDFYGVGLVSKPVSSEWLAWNQDLVLQASPIATLACVDAFSTTDFRADLAAFAGVPTLILHGTADKTVPIDVAARQTARYIPHAQVLEYDGAPHGLFATEPERLGDDLLRFLASAQGPATPAV